MTLTELPPPADVVRRLGARARRDASTRLAAGSALWLGCALGCVRASLSGPTAAPRPWPEVAERRSVSAMVLIGVVIVVVVVVLVLSERQRRREWEDLTRPGMGSRRARPGSGTGHLGEAPVTIHHRLGGRGRND